MIGLSKAFPAAIQRKKIERLLKESPSPSLARNHLLRLLEEGGAKALNKVPPAYLPALIRLIGSSSYLSDVSDPPGQALAGAFPPSDQDHPEVGG